MSMFLCAACDRMADSDDGCAPYRDSKFSLICADCMAEEPEEEAPSTDMSREGIYKKLIDMGCPADIADELAREKSR